MSLESQGEIALRDDIQNVISVLDSVVVSINMGIENANNMLKTGDTSLAYNYLSSGINAAYRILLDKKFLERFTDSSEIGLYAIYFGSVKTARTFSSVFYNKLFEKTSIIFDYIVAIRSIIQIYNQCNEVKNESNENLPMLKSEFKYADYMNLFSKIYIGKCIKITPNPDICKAIDTSTKSLSCLLLELDKKITELQNTLMDCLNAVSNYDTKKLINFCQ